MTRLIGAHAICVSARQHIAVGRIRLRAWRGQERDRYCVIQQARGRTRAAVSSDIPWTSPQDELSVRAVAGLREDGIAVPSGKPAAISDSDVANATHIFAIGCTLPDKAGRSGKAHDWSDVPDDKGYGPMRDAIVRHVTALLDDLQKRRK
jgi:hypothetical protein